MKSAVEHYSDSCRHLTNNHTICYCHTNNCNGISRFPLDGSRTEMLNISLYASEQVVSKRTELSSPVEENDTQLGQVAINDITAVKDPLLDSSCKYCSAEA